MNAELIIRILTTATLVGLLLAVGMRLTAGEVVAAVRRCRLTLVLLVNFAVVPALAVALAKVFRLDAAFATGMLLLAAAPFAPVVPVFARMAKADLALAAGLTALVTLLSAFLTPPVCALAMKLLSGGGALHFNLLPTLLTLVGTIVLPMALGVAARHLNPALALRGLRPIEICSEAIGALSLTFVTVTEFRGILATGGWSLLAMAILSEVALVLGYLAGHGASGSRQVVALGTSNRNIALALLLAIANFAGTPVVAAVVANGLLLILLGLLHVAWWRWTDRQGSAVDGQN